MKSSEVFNLVGIGIGAFFGSLIGGFTTKSPLGNGIGAGLGVLIGAYLMRILHKLPKDDPIRSQHKDNDSEHAT